MAAKNETLTDEIKQKTGEYIYSNL